MSDQFRILRPYLRGLPIIVLAMIAGFLFAKKYLSYQVPMYESTTKIKLADLHDGVTGNNLFKDLDVFASTNKIAAEIEVLKSQVLIEKMIHKLDFDEEVSRVGTVKINEIYTDKPFLHHINIIDASLYNKDILVSVFDTTHYNLTIDGIKGIYQGSFGDTLSIPNAAHILLSLNKDLINLKKQLAIIGKYKLVKHDTNTLTEYISRNLDVVSVDKDVAVLRIIFKSNVPEKAAKVTDALAQTYIEDYIEQKFKTADVTSSFLDEQIDKSYKKLSTAEMNIQGYRDDKNIINVRQETETDLRKISQLKIQKTNVKMSLDAIRQLNEYIDAGKTNFLELAPNFEAFTDLLSTEMVKKIKQLQAERTDLLLIYQPNHELVKNVDRKIKHHTDYFVESISNTRKNLETKYAKLCSDIEEAERVFVGLPERERMMNALDRSFQIHQQSYVFLNEKRVEAEIAKAAKHAFHRIIDKADIPKHAVSPNRPIIIIVCTLLGMMAALMFIFIVNASKGRVNDLPSIEKNTDLPILYAAPHFKNEIEASHFFKNEVMKMDMKSMLPSSTLLCVTAFEKSHGQSYNLKYLCDVFAKESRSALVLSFDPDCVNRLPNNHVRFMSEAEISSMSFIQLKEWISDHCENHDLVIIDNYALNRNDKAILFMGMSTINLFLVDTRKTLLKSITDLHLLATKENLPNFHLVLNNHKYSPSLVIEARWMIKQMKKKLIRK